MDIAGLSTALSYQKTATAYGTAMLSKSLDSMEAAGDGLLKLIDTASQTSARAMELSVNGSVGGNFDMAV
mgnify:CR=1 FL=1